MGRKAAPKAMDLETARYFPHENRLLATPEELSFLQEKVAVDTTPDAWLDQVWDCMDDVVRLLEWREISTKPIHISRSLAKVKGTKEADLIEARRVLHREESAGTGASPSKEDQVCRESQMFVNKKDEFINDDQWCISTADALCRLLACLCVRKVAMNVFTFLELVAGSNKATLQLNPRKMYLDLIGFELYAHAPIAVLRGEEVW